MDREGLIALIKEAGQAGVSKVMLSADGAVVIEFGRAPAPTHAAPVQTSEIPPIEFTPPPSDEELMLWSTSLEPTPDMPENLKATQGVN